MSQILKFEVYVYGRENPGEDLCVELYTKVGTAMKNRILHFGIAHPLDKEDVEFVGSRLQEVFEGTIIRVLGVHQQLV